MAELQTARWWTARRAQNLKPATYRCPLCGRHLPALTEHMLIMPEGRSNGRRHAHSACVLAARRAGKLPTREEWQRAVPQIDSRSSWWTRMRARLRARRQ